MFGATNQLLAGLAFLVISFWLWRRKAPVWFVVFPAIFMLVMPAAAMCLNLSKFWADRDWLLLSISVMALALEAWMVIEAARIWPKAKGVLEELLPPLPPQREHAMTGEPRDEGGRSC